MTAYLIFSFPFVEEKMLALFFVFFCVMTVTLTGKNCNFGAITT